MQIAHHSSSALTNSSCTLSARAGWPTLSSSCKTVRTINHQDQYGQTALMRAVKNGELERVSEAAMRSQKNRVSKKYRKIVWALLDAGADVNIRDNLGNRALFWAAWDGNVEVVQALLDAGAKA